MSTILDPWLLDLVRHEFPEALAWKRTNDARRDVVIKKEVTEDESDDDDDDDDDDDGESKYEDNGSCLWVRLSRGSHLQSDVQLSHIKFDTVGRARCMLADGATQIKAVMPVDIVAKLERTTGRKIEQLDGCIISPRVFQLGFTGYGSLEDMLSLNLDRIKFKSLSADPDHETEPRLLYAHDDLKPFWKILCGLERGQQQSGTTLSTTISNARTPGTVDESLRFAPESSASQYVLNTLNVHREPAFATQVSLNEQVEDTRTALQDSTSRAQYGSDARDALLRLFGNGDKASIISGDMAGGKERDDVEAELGADSQSMIESQRKQSSPIVVPVHYAEDASHDNPSRSRDSTLNQPLKKTSQPSPEPPSNAITSLSDVIDVSATHYRQPSPLYIKYARRKMPSSQVKLLARKQSWLPPFPGEQFSDSNIPLEVISALVQDRQSSMASCKVDNPMPDAAAMASNCHPTVCGKQNQTFPGTAAGQDDEALVQTPALDSNAEIDAGSDGDSDAVSWEPTQESVRPLDVPGLEDLPPDSSALSQLSQASSVGGAGPDKIREIGVEDSDEDMAIEVPRRLDRHVPRAKRARLTPDEAVLTSPQMPLARARTSHGMFDRVPATPLSGNLPARLSASKATQRTHSTTKALLANVAGSEPPSESPTKKRRRPALAFEDDEVVSQDPAAKHAEQRRSALRRMRQASAHNRRSPSADRVAENHAPVGSQGIHNHEPIMGTSDVASEAEQAKHASRASETAAHMDSEPRLSSQAAEHDALVYDESTRSTPQPFRPSNTAASGDDSDQTDVSLQIDVPMQDHETASDDCIGGDSKVAQVPAVVSERADGSTRTRSSPVKVSASGLDRARQSSPSIETIRRAAGQRSLTSAASRARSSRDKRDDSSVNIAPGGPDSRMSSASAVGSHHEETDRVHNGPDAFRTWNDSTIGVFARNYHEIGRDSSARASSAGEPKRRVDILAWSLRR